ncbi:MAG: hypothetical protein PVH54_11430 [Gammaproteobacteria bacterium]|jgi:hypothetical protein
MTLTRPVHPFLLWLMLAALCGAQPAGADDIDDLLDRVASAYGGRDRLAAATAFQQYGTTVTGLHRAPGRVHRAFQYPDRLRIQIHYSGDDSELRILSGALAWKQGTPVSGPLYSAMLLQAARLGLPNTLLDHRDRLRDAGTLQGRNGATLQALELPFHGNLRLVVGIDGATGRILESRGTIALDAERGMEFAAVYDDFREVSGRLFAFHETHYAMGSTMGQTTLERIEVTENLPAELFDGSRPDQPASDQHMAAR